MIERSIDDIVDTVRRTKDRGKSCSLLIGAGCSVKAGIPTAAGFVEIIREDYSREYDRANPKTYAKCMAELLPSEQRDLIAGKVDGAKINWAHICVALLMKAGYVDRVLTTNFDLLVSRACALLYEFPAIYDFAASQLYKRADIPKRAVIYLHGQRTGFVLMNTDEDLEHHSTLLAPVFEDAGSGRLWIVVGYSGESDPVFNHLAGVDGFDNGLFWIGYEDNDPSPDVRRRLLDADKSAFFTRGFDADRFFIELTQKLGIFPPQFIDHPFNHLDTMLEMLAPYPLGKEEDDQDVTKQARAAIQEAATTYDSQHTPAAEAQAFLMAGKYDDVIALGEENREDLSPEFADTFSWASVLQGNGLLEQTRTKEGEEADELYAQAYGKYEAALAIKPDKHEALNNWGSGLSDQAKTREDEEADELFAQAYGKYEAALAIKSDKHAALYNWGNGLSGQAKAREGEEADELYAQAYGKYEAALASKPDMHEALFNWGNGLSEQARTKDGEEADELYAQVYGKYQAALAIKPDKHEALFNWGNGLSEQARTKEGEEADELYAQAYGKYEAALASKLDMHKALFNWGSGLSDQAMKREGEEADELYAQAYGKYEAALAIKSDMHEALSNWGNGLLEQAKAKDGEEADELYAQVYGKYEAALAIKPDKHEALYNWGSGLSDQARTREGEEADELYAQAYGKYEAARAIKPDKHEALKNWGSALSDQAVKKHGEERRRLLEEARRNGLRAEELSPGQAAYNLACVAALRNDEADTRTWLEASKAAGKLPSIAHIKEDSDLDSIRDTEWFQEFLRGLEDDAD